MKWDLFLDQLGLTHDCIDDSRPACSESENLLEPGREELPDWKKKFKNKNVSQTSLLLLTNQASKVIYKCVES